MDLKRLKWLGVVAFIILSSSLFAETGTMPKLTDTEQLIIERDCQQLGVLYTQAVDFNQAEKLPIYLPSTAAGPWVHRKLLVARP